MDKRIIVGVHVVDREAHTVKVQEVFTQYSAQIKTRLGVHEDIFPSNVLILLEMVDTAETCQMIEAVEAIEGVDCKIIIFEH